MLSQTPFPKPSDLSRGLCAWESRVAACAGPASPPRWGACPQPPAGALVTPRSERLLPFPLFLGGSQEINICWVKAHSPFP